MGCMTFFLAAMTTYEVSVTTGDVKGAGTDANVYLTLYGETSDTGLFNSIYFIFHTYHSRLELCLSKSVLVLCLKWR